MNIQIHRKSGFSHYIYGVGVSDEFGDFYVKRHSFWKRTVLSIEFESGTTIRYDKSNYILTRHLDIVCDDDVLGKLSITLNSNCKYLEAEDYRIDIRKKTISGIMNNLKAKETICEVYSNDSKTFEFSIENNEKGKMVAEMPSSSNLMENFAMCTYYWYCEMSNRVQ